MNAAVEQVQLDAIQRFARSAEAFCALMESSQALAADVFVRRSASALAALYSDALELPDLFDDSCAETIHPPFSAPQVYTSVHEHLQRLDAYSAYADPYNADSGIGRLLSDDLGDVHADVRSGLEIYQQGTHCAIVDAVFDWKFLFLTHWGRHLVSALTALHQIIAENLLAGDERAD